MKNVLTAQAIFLGKQSRIFVDAARGEGVPPSVVAAFSRNLEELGYTLSPTLFERLAESSEREIERLYQEVLPVLRQKVGAHRRFRPMYPNFPAQVMEASDLELYLNARLHYFSAWVSDMTGEPGFVWLPKYDAKTRAPLTEAVQLRVVDFGTPEEFDRIFTQLVSSNGSLSESDKEIVSWFVQNRRGDLDRLLPESIPSKENLAYLVGLLLGGELPRALQASLKTATDVLRVAVALSGGDVSLAQPTRFRKFSRKERRFFLGALDAIENVAEDMLRHAGAWVRLGEILHPGEFKARFPAAHAGFAVVRGAVEFQTFNGKVEAYLSVGKVEDAVTLLVQRPGDFARRLDHLLRLNHRVGDLVVGSFLGVAERVSTPVLVQVFQHFAARQESRAYRAFFPKGNVAKMQVVDNTLPRLNAALTDALSEGVREVLVGRFAQQPSLGKVYVDEALRTQIVPFAQRSASRALRTLARGSRIALPESNILRFFLWWKDGEDRTDIDLSAVFYGEDWQETGVVSFYSLREFGCAHSGDITSAPNGACEFIDIDRARLLKKGVRYVAMTLNSFTHQRYRDLPECFAGWMARSEPQSGELFEPRTVQDRVDLASDTTACIPVVFDLEAGEVIWADLALTSRSMYNTAWHNRRGQSLMAQAIAELNKPNLYDLFQMHAKARGTLVSEREGADTVFSLHEGVTPYDIDRILSEFLA